MDRFLVKLPKVREETASGRKRRKYDHDYLKLGFSWTGPGRGGLAICVFWRITERPVVARLSAGRQRAVDGRLGSLTAGTALYFNFNNTYFDQKQVPVKAAGRG